MPGVRGDLVVEAAPHVPVGTGRRVRRGGLRGPPGGIASDQLQTPARHRGEVRVPARARQVEHSLCVHAEEVLVRRGGRAGRGEHGDEGGRRSERPAAEGASREHGDEVGPGRPGPVPPGRGLDVCRTSRRRSRLQIAGKRLRSESMRLRRDSSAELRRLYREHVDAVYAFFAYSVPRPFAEDLTSGTFERVVRSWTSYDRRLGSERPLIHTIARNLLT